MRETYCEVCQTSTFVNCTAPEPFGVKRILPFVFVDDNVLPFNSKFPADNVVVTFQLSISPDEFRTGIDSAAVSKVPAAVGSIKSVYN